MLCPKNQVDKLEAGLVLKHQPRDNKYKFEKYSKKEKEKLIDNAINILDTPYWYTPNEEVPF